MSDAYRQSLMQCPACANTLRDFHGRLCCDKCDGMMLSLDELKRAIYDITGGLESELQFVDEAAGKRKCPTCGQPLSTCNLRVVIDEELAKPRPVLDRCIDHGLWFDGEELAKVLEKVRAKVSPKGTPLGWQGDRRGFEWWKGPR